MMTTAYAAGTRALGICDRCGLTYKLRELRKLTVSGVQSSLKVCPDCWEPDHPQNEIQTDIVDAQALYEPRPDERAADMTNIWWGWNPVFSVVSKAQVGVVTVSAT